MGLKSFIFKFFRPKDISKSKISEALDKYILSSQKEHQETIRTANKLLKGKLLQQQSREIVKSIRSLDADEEEEEETSFEDRIQEFIMGKLLSNVGSGSPAPQQTQDPVNDFGLSAADNLPINAEAPKQTIEGSSPIRQEASQLLVSLSDDQLQKLKKKWFK